MDSRLATEANPAVISHADAVRIREALGDILQSPPFRSSRQCQVFLTYVVEHSLAGENDLLRERVIGTEVFGRTPHYETGEDPVVRVRAAEVRKRLAQYYQNRADCPVRIDIPPGSYRAVFQWKSGQLVAPAGEKRGSRRSPWNWIILGLAAAAIIGIAGRGLRSHAPSALDQFWASALASPKPILIYNATTTVYHAASAADVEHEFIPVRGQYTCIGDAYASVVLSSLFSRKGKLYQMRYGADLTFGDLRYQPSILIGAFNNEWTLQTTNELRFVFDTHPTIRDRLDNQLYTPADLKPDGRTTEDYAIVSRVFDSKTGELLIAAAGITQYGTRAAGEFLTSIPSITALAANAPRDWPKKNLQVLLRTKVVGDTPGPPSIVKTYFW
ncbi:MAG: hypothetical protein JO319_04010 [Acidobacteriaceae bacterium]|nr:hypothetical protein [Acidobacteriaceae bacterium]